MILQDELLIKKAVDGLVKPYNLNNVGPASIDLTLDSEFLFLMEEPDQEPTPLKSETDVKKYIYTDKFDDELVIHPGEFVLGTTVEKIDLPANLAAFIQGRSSIGRLGIFIENAGFIDPGFSGQITLELYNASPKKYKIEAGTKICQLIVHQLKGPALYSYNGKYQGQRGTTGSRIYQDFEKKKGDDDVKMEQEKNN